MKKKNIFMALLSVGILVACVNEGNNSSSYSSSSNSSVTSSSSTSNNQGSSTSTSSTGGNSSSNNTSSSDGNNTSSNTGNNTSNNGNNNSSPSENSSSSEDPIPTDFKEKAKYYYDQLGNNQKLFYTDGNEYMAFDDGETSHYLGTYNSETNSFSETGKDKFAFDITNNGDLILINRNTSEDPSDDFVYSLFTDEGIDEEVNSSKYNPYYYLKTGDIYAKNSDSAKRELQSAAGDQAIPTKVLNDIYVLKGEIEIPSRLFDTDVTNVFNVGELSEITKITIKEGITKINAYGLKRNTSLEALVLPNSLNEIGESAFTGCTKLTTLDLDGVDNITTYENGSITSNITKVIFSSRKVDSYYYFPHASFKGSEEFKDNSKFSSVDDAFNTRNKINTLLQVEPSSKDEHTSTYETSLSEIKADQTLVMPIDKSGEIRNYNNTSAKETAYDETKLFAQLKLNADLVVRGTIQLAAMINSTSQPVQGRISGLYTQIDLNGHKLTIEDGGLIECNGKIIDSSSQKSGKIIVNKGGTIISDFIVDDFFGGSITFGRYSGNVSPFNKYRMSYIEPETEIHYGGVYKGYCVLYAMSMHNETTQVIVGEGGLFEIENEESKIVKTVDGATRNETISTYGNVKTNSMSLGLMNGLVKVTTDKVLFPLPRHYTINICSGTFTLNSMVKVLPGAEVNVHKDATIKLNYSGESDAAKVIVYDTFWDYSEDTKSNFEDTCNDSEWHNDKGAHKYPYYDINVDPTLTKDGKDAPGKLIINGNVEFGDAEGIAIAGNIYTSNENLENLKNAFDAAKDKISFHVDSDEGAATGEFFDAKFDKCFTMKKTSLNIYVGDELKETFTNTSDAQEIKNS